MTEYKRIVIAGGGFAGLALDWIGQVSRAWLLTWALGSTLWLGGMRLGWSYCFLATLRRGACLERALVVADDRRNADLTLEVPALPGVQQFVRIGPGRRR